MKKLRIAQFVTALRSLPAGKDVIWAPMDLALDIAEGAVAEGHDMTFYAPEASRIPYKVISGGLEYGISDPAFLKKTEAERKAMPYASQQATLFDQYLLSRMFADAAKGRYDVLHVHSERALPFVADCPVPILITLHDPISAYGRIVYRLFKGKKARFISISMAQRRPAPDLSYAANIYNGVDTDLFRPSGAKRSAFLFCSRLVQQKGVEDAIMAAKMAGERLDVVGKHYNAAYLEKVRALCTGPVKYVGMRPRASLPGIYGKAKALLFPIKWEEPFGLVMIEAMACGTPVIAYDRGSVREVIEDGVTGFIVKTPKQMAAAMKRIDEIDPQACRDRVERLFSIERMVDRYLATYRAAAKK